MTQKTDKLPFSVSDYISRHFREDFLFRLKEVKKAGDHTQYLVEVTKDNLIYHVRFNEQGHVLKEEAVQAFPPDLHEEPGDEEVRPDDF